MMKLRERMKPRRLTHRNGSPEIMRGVLKLSRSPTSVADVKPAPYNPRQISNDQLTTLKQTMKEYGDLGGIVYNLTTGHLVGGHQRAKSLDPTWRIHKHPAKDTTGTVSLGYIETPQGRFNYREVRWPLRKEKAANLAANKISGEWDNHKLAPILEELAPLPDLSMTGFTLPEANLIIETLKLEDQDDKQDHIPPLDHNAPRIKLGDAWGLGNHRLVCGDATNQNC